MGMIVIKIIVIKSKYLSYSISLLGSVLEVIEKLRPFARRSVSIWVNCLEDILITHFFLSVILVAL